ncbi:24805_t:CDS:2, partial [Dentiscutata erythropus]
MYAFLAILLFFVRRNKSPAPTPTPIPVTINTDIDELKQDMLAIKNEIVRMQSDAEWRSEVRRQASIQSHRSEYIIVTETLWVEFTALFDERRKRDKCSPTKIYNALSIEIGLSPATLATFYRHQRAPLTTSLDKIEIWVKRENKKKDNSIIISSGNRGLSSHNSGASVLPTHNFS